MESAFNQKVFIVADQELIELHQRLMKLAIASLVFGRRMWTCDEIFAVLKLRAEAGRVHAKRVWHYVSENLFLLDGYDGDSKSCEYLWGALRRSYSAVRDHEAKVHSGGMKGCDISYWGMSMFERLLRNLPLSFHLEWYETMERILNAQSLGKDAESTRTILQTDGHLPSEAGTEETESQAEVTTDGHAPHTDTSHEDCHETNSKYTGRKRPAAVDEDDLIATITPLINKHLDDALQPLMSALRGRQEEELKHRQKMQTIEEKMLALKRKETRILHLPANSPGVGDVASKAETVSVAQW